jgi:hypothetical protein
MTAATEPEANVPSAARRIAPAAKQIVIHRRRPTRSITNAQASKSATCATLVSVPARNA